MITREMVGRLQRIRLRTLRMISGMRSGDFVVKLRESSGIEFDTLRDYQHGDDVRRIDWNSSGRSNKIMVRSFREQKNRRILIVLDDSLSMHVGSTHELKSDLARLLAATVLYAGDFCGDAVGVAITHNNQLQNVLLPNTGTQHIIACGAAIMSENSGKVSAGSANRSIFTLLPRKSLLIILTDGLVPEYEDWWRKLAQRYEVMVVRVRDRYEKIMPHRVSCALEDPESGMCLENGAGFQAGILAWYASQEKIAKRLGMRLLDVTAGESHHILVKAFFEYGR